jgi:hypothetical protein
MARQRAPCHSRTLHPVPPGLAVVGRAVQLGPVDVAQAPHTIACKYIWSPIVMMSVGRTVVTVRPSMTEPCS